jgi:transketolase
MNLQFVNKTEIDRLAGRDGPWTERLGLIADACRLNALVAVKRAGSGHLGSSFSSIDIMVWLYFRALNATSRTDPDRDIFFSSKGHDCPAQYSVLAAKGILPWDSLFRLRRYGGLYGHPDVSTPGIEANTGSLGMGISKAKGMVWAKRHLGHAGRVFVLTGDGELQEGQIWESMQTAVHQGLHNMFAIVDANKLQTDKLVRDIIDLGDLVGKATAFGWHVERADGHDFKALDQALARAGQIKKPKMILADTVKGKGVSFMETLSDLDGGGVYRWHSGAPDDRFYELAHAEIRQRLDRKLAEVSARPVQLETLAAEPASSMKVAITPEKIVNAYGEALVRLAEKDPRIVVLDGDLSQDCGLRPFEERFPERFIENGIAEQDMVSTAGGLARLGLLPIVNSFSSFLSARANEQIYNNAGERTKVIYACHYAGLIPAGPGKSHQSVRDISLFAAIPGCTLLEPCNSQETALALQWCVDEAEGPCMLRLAISACPRTIRLAESYRLAHGRGVTLKPGAEAVLFSHGPVLLHEALTAAEVLEGAGFSLQVVNMPWLNHTNAEWLAETVQSAKYIFVAENHAPTGGLGDSLLHSLAAEGLLQGRGFKKFSVNGHLACGTPWEALRHHRLDALSLVDSMSAAAGLDRKGKYREAVLSASGGADVQ